jgi:two-component system chemotaxis sensor kinase CheA
MSDDIIQTFAVECSELLQDTESSLLQLESSPDDNDLINAVFRAAHTIKGTSGMLGFSNIERFTHKVENVLEKVRQGEVKIDNNLIGLLLKCVDHTSSLLDAAVSDKSESESLKSTGDDLVNQLDTYLGNISSEPAEVSVEEAVTEDPDVNAPENLFNGKTVETENWHISLRLGRNILRDGMDPISFINYLSRLGEIVSLTTITDAIPSAEEMDPESCYLGFEIDYRSEFDKQTIEDVFEFIREDCNICILPPHSKIDEYINLINNLPETPSKLGEILIDGGALTQSELEEALQMQYTETGSVTEEQTEEPKRRLGEIIVDEKMVHPPVVEAALEKQKEVKSREARTIRVDINKLDQLVNLVGELVIANANIIQHAQRIGDTDMLEAMSTLSRLVEDIRDRAMQVRMIPIGDIFGRFNRVIRDINRDSGKDIELVISGGESELDKNMVEKLNDPLMHLVRNAADHGIESPAVRREKGKPEKGTVRLNAFNDTGSMVIEISDDGAGLSREKILKKAVDKGMVNPEQSLSDKEIYRLIFEPGLSTADQVTNLSGRGVGMDVVRRNIEELRGTVDVDSHEGTGSTVQVRLPLTLAIIDGFMVGVGSSLYIIPLDMVVECTELSKADRQTSNKRNYVNLRGEVLPYIRLRNLFNEKGKEAEHENIIVVQAAGVKTGLVVDELHGEAQTVIKSLGSAYKDVDGVSGATILGDGSVALILDIPKLVQSYTEGAGMGIN